MLERPRRDEVDTAFWQPTLRTDTNGAAHFSFTMPDALTRWRLTARGITRDGTVGQRTAFVRSDKDLYGKWTSPAWTRMGDAPIATVAIFNQTTTPQRADIAITGAGLSTDSGRHSAAWREFHRSAFAECDVRHGLGGHQPRRFTVVDRLETVVTSLPTAWLSDHTSFVKHRRHTAGVAPGCAGYSRQLRELGGR